MRIWKRAGAVVVTALMVTLGTSSTAQADTNIGKRWYSNWGFSGWDAVMRENCNLPDFYPHQNDALELISSGVDEYGYNGYCEVNSVWQIASSGAYVFYATACCPNWGTDFVWTDHGWGGAGSAADLYTYQHQDNQRWVVEFPSDGSRIVHAYFNQSLCIEDPGASSTNGVNLKMATCNGWNRQKFTSHNY